MTFKRLYYWMAWVGAWLPAIFVLAFISPLRVPVPSYDSWAFVEQYLLWKDGNYGWQNLFAPHNQHPAAVGKLVYLAVMELADGDVALLPLLSWLFSLGIACSVFVLSKPLWEGKPFFGAFLIFLSNLTIFSLAQSESWLWDFIYQNYIPGFCLAVSLAVLQRAKKAWVKISTALFASAIATFSFGTGFLVSLLLAPTLFFLVGKGIRQRILTLAVWLAWSGFVTWLAIGYFGKGHAESAASGQRISELLGQSFNVIQYLLILLGLPFSRGTELEPAWFGMLTGLVLCIALSAVLIWLLKNRELLRWKAALPWLTFCSWGVLNAGLICLGRLENSMISALATRYVTFTLFFALGVVMLVAMMLESGQFPKAFVMRAGTVATTLLLTGHSLAWISGAHAVEIFYLKLRQEKAALEFSSELKLEEGLLWTFVGDDGVALTPGYAQKLDKLGKLRKVVFLKSTDISELRLSAPLNADRASWSITPSYDASEEWTLHGNSPLSRDPVSMPELIVFTAQSASGKEQIVQLARPYLPEDIYQQEWRRKLYPSHYYGWSQKLQNARLPSGDEIVLRAYAFGLDKRRLRQLPEEFALNRSTSQIKLVNRVR